jgi:hypothetical protein
LEELFSAADDDEFTSRCQGIAPRAGISGVHSATNCYLRSKFTLDPVSEEVRICIRTENYAPLLVFMLRATDVEHDDSYSLHAMFFSVTTVTKV